MARTLTIQNTRNRLNEAMAVLIRTQAAFDQTQSAIADMARTERENAERFARIERNMAAILRVLAEHGRMLERLPEAVREKFGFKGQE